LCLQSGAITGVTEEPPFSRYPLDIQKMVAGYSVARLSSYRTHEALSQNTGVFIDLALRNWNLTRCSVSETEKGPPAHGDKRRRLSRRLYSWGWLTNIGKLPPTPWKQEWFNMSCSLELYFINLLRYKYFFKASEANRHHKTSFSFPLCFVLHARARTSCTSHVPTLGHVKEPSSCSSLGAAGRIRMFSYLPSLIEASRAAWCGVPLEMKEGTIPIRGTKGLSTRPRCITLITQLNVMYRDVSVALPQSRMGGSPTCVTAAEICLYTFSWWSVWEKFDTAWVPIHYMRP
jgi:hypothetical protein